MNNEMVTKADITAQTNMLCEIKVVTKKTGASLCRITGETSDPILDEIAGALPLTTLVAIAEVEEKLAEPQYSQAMTAHIHKLKGVTDDMNTVIKGVFTDELLADFNWDGVASKHSLGGLTLVDKVISDVFKHHGSKRFIEACRKAITLSHNRLKQIKFFLQAKGFAKGTTSV